MMRSVHKIERCLTLFKKVQSRGFTGTVWLTKELRMNMGRKQMSRSNSKKRVRTKSKRKASNKMRRQ